MNNEPGALLQPLWPVAEFKRNPCQTARRIFLKCSVVQILFTEASAMETDEASDSTHLLIITHIFLLTQNTCLSYQYKRSSSLYDQFHDEGILLHLFMGAAKAGAAVLRAGGRFMTEHIMQKPWRQAGHVTIRRYYMQDLRASATCPPNSTAQSLYHLWAK